MTEQLPPGLAKRKRAPARPAAGQAPPARDTPDVLLTADQILAADDRPIEKVAVPEWGGHVLVRGLDGRGRAEYEATNVVVRDGKAYADTANLYAKLVARCLVNAAGEPVFTQQNVHALGQKSSAALIRVFNVASRLSGLDEEGLEGLEKDLQTSLSLDGPGA